jgi:TRAP-type C4-dicarboxylate transport system permease small subunit
MRTIEQVKKIGKKLFDIYFGIGVVAMGLLAVLVIFTVVMRYCFDLNWKELAEFNITLFAFTTFWGMGVNIIKNEHVIIDILYDGLKPTVKRWISVLNYIIVLVVDVVFTHQSVLYTLKMGKQISQGMEIPMYFMYGIMPVSGAICAICIVIRIIEFIKADDAYFAPKNKALSKDGAEKKGE